MVCRWSSQVQLQQGTEPPCIWSLRYEQRCKPFFQFYKLQEMTCTSQNHFLISIGNSHDLKSQQSKARPSNILWKISVLLEVCIFPADVNLQRLRDRAFSIHGGQAGYMVVLWELLSAAGFRRTAWWRPPQGISRNVVFFSCMHLNVNNMWSGFAHSLSRSFLSTIARSPFRPFDYLCLPFFFVLPSLM